MRRDGQKNRSKINHLVETKLDQHYYFFFGGIEG
jgi:hypothetical protein